MHRLERLLHLIPVLANLWMTNCDVCNVLITQAAISKSWQSSSYNKSDGSQMCGFGSSAIINTAVGIASADAGYHWLVVQLLQPMLIADVTMKPAGQTGSPEDRMSQAEDIEVWTSSQEVNFGSETCSSTQIGSKFASKMSSWVMCGKTGRVDRDGNVKAQCTNEANHLVSMVLLRKNVSSISILDRQCMSFTQLKFIAGPNVTLTIRPSDQVLQNSNVTVSCNVTQCADGTVNIAIYHSKENSVKVSKIGSIKQDRISYHIASAQPSHSGRYKCVVADKVLSVVELNVINPPKQLRMSVHESSCNAQSPKVTFAFDSSESQSKPHHQCTVSDSHGNHVTLMKSREDAESHLGGAMSLRSLWLCQNCSSAGNLTVQCTAVLLHLNQSYATASGTGTVLWNSSALISLDLNAELTKLCPNASSNSNKTPTILVSIILPVAIVFTIIFLKLRRQSQLRSNRPAALPSADPIPLPRADTTVPLTSMGDDEPPPKLPLRTQPNAENFVDQEFGTASTYTTVIPATTVPKHCHAGKANPESDDEAVRLCCRAGSEITVYLEILADGALEAE